MKVTWKRKKFRLDRRRREAAIDHEVMSGDERRGGR
jgi:hypothetical protein